MRIVRALAIVGLFASPVFAQSLPERPLPNYPHTRASELVEDHFGEMVADPFRWLENDVRTNQEVRDWVNRENALSNGYLSALPGRTILAERMKHMWTTPTYKISEQIF